MLANSALVFVEENETGAKQDDDLIPPVLVNGTPLTLGIREQRMMGGMARFFKAGSGSKIQSFSSNRPGDSWEKIIDRIIHAAMRGINWSPMLAWGTSNPGGQLARSDGDQCRASVADRQDLFRNPARRRVGRAVAKAIKIGALPAYPGPDLGGFLKWGFSMPGEITIDANNDRKNDREDLRMGIKLHSGIVGANGDGAYPDFTEKTRRRGGDSQARRVEPQPDARHDCRQARGR